MCDNGAPIPAISPPANAVVYSTAYSYNAMNRPTGVTFDPVPAPTLPSTASATSFDFGYNAANQRVSFAATDNGWIDYPTGPASTTSYTANSLNQYTAVGAVTPGYDGNGNLTSDGTFTFGYDAENRLTAASKTGTSAVYAFDALGRRKGKSVTVGATTTTTLFVTDADNREVLEYDAGTASILRWYAYGLGPNDVLSQAEVGAGARATPIPDILGSIAALMDAGSGTLTKYGYKPYGTSSAAPSQFGFTGQRIDPELGGYYYFRARHYSPMWGRFLQPDPIGYAGSINIYGYVGNDPLNAIDPTGLCVQDACIIEGSAAAAAYGVLYALVAAGVCVQVCQPILESIQSMAGSVWSQVGPTFMKPPANAWDPNGPKAPGYPGGENGHPDYKDPKGGPNWVPSPNGSGYGWQDKAGNVWVPTGPKGPGKDAHGGPHWDVQTPGGRYQNKRPPLLSNSEFITLDDWISRASVTSPFGANASGLLTRGSIGFGSFASGLYNLSGVTGPKK